jgi:hypothetical protein
MRTWNQRTEGKIDAHRIENFADWLSGAVSGCRVSKPGAVESDNGERSEAQDHGVLEKDVP